MKYNFLIKVTPFLSTLLLIVFLSFSNQKEYTKLRILIWNTPSLTLGTYISLSTGVGFLFSYFLTDYIANIKRKSLKPSLRFKGENEYEKNSEFNDNYLEPLSDKTLIERDIKDPSPTVNANFRIITRTDRSNISFINNRNDLYDDASEFTEEYYDDTEVKERQIKNKSSTNDWNDDSFSRW